VLKRKLAGVVVAIAALVGVGLPAQAATTAVNDTTQLDSPNAAAVKYLIRYVNNSGVHRVTTVGVTAPGYWPERGGLWGIYNAPLANTRALYECRNNGLDIFVSTSATCEGKTVLSRLGWLYKSKPKQVSVLLYRCLVPKKGHFVSTLKNCEGWKNEGPLGWALHPGNYVTFSRFNSGPDHWETTYGIGAGYRREYTWYLAQGAPAKTAPLYSCVQMIGSRVDHFLSRANNCEGKKKVRHEGYVYLAKAGSTFAPLYRCILTNGDHYATTSSVCENAPGAKREFVLGWVRNKMW
jgi:hypothetical protein